MVFTSLFGLQIPTTDIAFVWRHRLLGTCYTHSLELYSSEKESGDQAKKKHQKANIDFEDKNKLSRGKAEKIRGLEQGLRGVQMVVYCSPSADVPVSYCASFTLQSIV